MRGNHTWQKAVSCSLRSIPACAGEPARPSARGRRRRVYPRVCGGTTTPAGLAIPTCGLSPRVRGNPSSSIHASTRIRSIPACAGEPANAVRSSALWTVYPRVCGGTYQAQLRDLLASGLSPRVRGNHPTRRAGDCQVGSIPACAGEPWTITRSCRSRGVYPRVCGGTCLRYRLVDARQGLSPRVRGNPFQAGSRRSVGRSIPACAGEPKC